jgi:tRNA(His) 5'-end guanylyltransferase
MKENYENPSKHRLIKRTPVIVRLDGKAFHTFTRGFAKPFDPILIKAMQLTMLDLCQNIQGIVFGYTQSDEISLFLQDFETFETSAWFDYEIQKICSISASMATLYFNKHFRDLVVKYDTLESKEQEARIKSAMNGALFDARCFNVPKEEVTNYFYSRQVDAIRNSIQMVGQAYFTPKELNRKSCENIKEMLKEKGIEWESYRICEQRGSACHKEDKWVLDKKIPVFKDEGRDYIEKLIPVGE